MQLLDEDNITFVTDDENEKIENDDSSEKNSSKTGQIPSKVINHISNVNNNCSITNLNIYRAK